jgi:biopolymer transport protein ExbD
MVAVDVAPLIDIVFILLIFFLVTTTFVRDRGVPVTRPAAAHAAVLEPEAVRIHLTAEGRLFLAGQPVTVARLPERVGGMLAQRPQAAVVIVPDEQVPAGRLVAVLDAARAGGARDVALATRPREAD